MDKLIKGKYFKRIMGNINEPREKESLWLKKKGRFKAIRICFE
jgi:hypothetical protein